MGERAELIFEAVGAQKFNKEILENDRALRRQAQALDSSALALQKEVLALRGVSKPNKELIVQVDITLLVNQFFHFIRITSYYSNRWFIH